MRETTERVNKFIPVAEAGGLGQVPGEGKRGVMVPGPATEEIAIGQTKEDWLTEYI